MMIYILRLAPTVLGTRCYENQPEYCRSFAEGLRSIQFVDRDSYMKNTLCSLSDDPYYSSTEPSNRSIQYGVGNVYSYDSFNQPDVHVINGPIYSEIKKYLRDADSESQSCQDDPRYNTKWAQPQRNQQQRLREVHSPDFHNNSAKGESISSEEVDLLDQSTSLEDSAKEGKEPPEKAKDEKKSCMDSMPEKRVIKHEYQKLRDGSYHEIHVEDITKGVQDEKRAADSDKKQSDLAEEDNTLTLRKRVKDLRNTITCLLSTISNYD